MMWQESSELEKAVVKGSQSWYDVPSESLKPVDIPNIPKDTSNSGVDFLAGLFEFFQSLGVLAAGLVIVAIVLLIVWMVLYVRRMGKTSVAVTSHSGTRTTVARHDLLPEVLGPMEGDLMSMARAARAEGDIRQAFTYLYGHVLLQLHAAHLLRLDPAKTNNTYHREIKAHHINAFFGRMVRGFEVHFFGPNPNDAGQWDGLLGEFQSIEAGLAS